MLYASLTSLTCQFGSEEVLRAYP